MKTEITKIKLILNGRDIELSADEARQIYKELGELFKMAEPVKEFVPYPAYHPPIIIERERTQWPHNPWEIWCVADSPDSNTATMLLNLDNGR